MDFCILFFLSCDLTESICQFQQFLVEFLEFSIYSIMSSANCESFTSSLAIWMLFISFSCLIVVVRTSSIMLNKSVEKTSLSCSLSQGKLSIFHQCEYDVNCGFSYMAFIMLRYVLSKPTLLRVLIMNGISCLFDNSYSHGCEVIFHCDFDFHFPDGQ